MVTSFSDRTPFLIAIEEQGEVVAVCEGRVYPFMYNKKQAEAGIEQPIQEKAIFIEQTGIKPGYRGNKQDNTADRLYVELYDLAEKEGVSLLIGGVNKKNIISRKVVERQGRHHIAMPPMDR